MNKYRVKYLESYKWATVIDTYVVEANSEEEARNKVDEAEGELINTEIDSLENIKSSYFLDVEFINSLSKKEENQIKKRVSYKMFSDFLSLIKTKNDEEILKELHRLLDSKSAYGSMKASIYAQESLDLIISEIKE